MPALTLRTLLAWLGLLGVLISGGLSPATAAITDYPFRLFNEAAGTGRQVVAENNGPAPITVHVTLTGQNVASDQNWPLTTVVPPYTALPLGRVYAGDRRADGLDFLFRYSHHFGRPDAVHDPDAAYRLPFEDGRGFAVSQAYGGRLSSHENSALMHAIDFAMPVGSAVTAARAGVVADVTLHYQEGGYDMSYRDKANTVVIVHDDGTVAEYAHLSPGPAIVTPGLRVAAGELLGYSGSTGYASDAHLHFIVTRPVVSDDKVIRVSVPVLFYASNPAVRFSPQMGTTVWANYGTAPEIVAGQ